MANKYQVLLVDYRYNGKGDKLIKRWYSIDTAMKKGKELVAAEGYVTFKLLPHKDNIRKEYK